MGLRPCVKPLSCFATCCPKMQLGTHLPHSSMRTEHGPFLHGPQKPSRKQPLRYSRAIPHPNRENCERGDESEGLFENIRSWKASFVGKPGSRMPTGSAPAASVVYNAKRCSGPRFKIPSGRSKEKTCQRLGSGSSPP